jgi:hypothetical protein
MPMRSGCMLPMHSLLLTQKGRSCNTARHDMVCAVLGTAYLSELRVRLQDLRWLAVV